MRAGVINHDAEAIQRVLLEDAALIAEATSTGIRTITPRQWLDE